VKIKETQRFKQELHAIVHCIKKDKPNASIKFAKNLKIAIKNLLDLPYQCRYLEVLTIFNQNLPDLP